MSGLHSFRSLVTSEWLLRGRVTYVIKVNTLRPPGALGIGVVGPLCQVNSDVAWAAGPTAWRTNGCGECYGFVWEGCDTERTHEFRALPHGQWTSFQGCPVLEGGKRADDSGQHRIQQGDTVRATIDLARQTLQVCVHRPDTGESTRVETIQTGLRGATLGIKGRPMLALSVALKFAADSVSIARADVADDEPWILSDESLAQESRDYAPSHGPSRGRIAELQ